MKDAARLAAYFIAIVVIGALLAPILFWSAQALAAHGVFPFLTKYDFDTFFHRAILVAAVLLLWPLLRVSNVRGLADLDLAPNPQWGRDVGFGVLLSVIPLLFCGALLIALHVYSFRHVLVWPRLGKVFLAAVSVPFIEETFFRGIVLGILLRTESQANVGHSRVRTLCSSAFLERIGMGTANRNMDLGFPSHRRRLRRIR